MEQWERHPRAEAFVMGVLEECCEANRAVAELKEELHRQTSTRLFDWLDHVVIGHSVGAVQELEEVGYIQERVAESYRTYFHPGAQLPRVVVRDTGPETIGVAVSVECISEFLMVRGLHRWIEGELLSGYRRCSISTENEVSLWVVERRGTWSMEPTHPEEGSIISYLEATEKWEARPRGLDDEDEAMECTLQLATELVDAVGQDMAAWIVLECERKYWESRNVAGQLQKSRQDLLGMGWANHDHHTFRSSRKHFPKLVRLFEILGFHCRERFYAGEEAGWGAQVMENPRCGLILFLDVDLEPHELEIDFAHHPIPEIKHLGTIGLWCALHGDSILKAGMHHLEAQFFFDELTKDLEHLGIGMMDPFSSFSYLKQAFTHGEIWSVNPSRVQPLLDTGKITHEEAEKFLSYGAVGSHLENLQRREGYKGFNQKNVSFIIKKTDPRLQL